MRVVDEHECKYLKNQNHSDDDIIAVQEMVEDTKKEVKYLGWYLVNYRERDKDIAFGIRCCPYCGKKLRD